MEMINTMENKLFNMMGSEVVSGFTCKPVKLVPDKPIMHFKKHIFLFVLMKDVEVLIKMRILLLI